MYISTEARTRPYRAPYKWKLLESLEESTCIGGSMHVT